MVTTPAQDPIVKEVTIIDWARVRELRDEIEYRIKQYSYCIMNNTKNYRDWLQEDYERRLRLKISQLFAARM